MSKKLNLKKSRASYNKKKKFPETITFHANSSFHVKSRTAGKV